MKIELLPLDPSFENGIAIQVSEAPDAMVRPDKSFHVAASHPSRPGVVLRQQFTPPAGCERSELTNIMVWMRYLPESWRLIANALWAAGDDAYHEVQTFEDQPVGLGEVRANKSGNAANWKPREALVELLRRIDSGDYPDMDALVLCFRTKSKTGEINSFYSAASPDIHTTLGVVSRAEFSMQQGATADC